MALPILEPVTRPRFDAEFDIRVPGLALEEPLRPRPFSGAIYGALLGLVFGWLSSSAQGDLDLPGSIAGGAIGGLVIGTCVPLFRRRWAAGVIVATGAAAGFYAAMPRLRDQFGWGATIFLGVCAGIVYAALFWDYRAPKSPSGEAPNEGE